MPEFIRQPLEGLFPLIPLSLDRNQEIDMDGVRHSIGLVAASGAPGCIVFGSMGQMTSVSEREFDAVCELAVETGQRDGIAVVGEQDARQVQNVAFHPLAEQTKWSPESVL